VAFLPLFFVGGVMGKFIRHIPIPVVAALSVSLIEALFILPVHLRHLPDLNRTWGPQALRGLRAVRRGTGGALVWCVDRVYGPVIDRVLRWRYAALAASVAVLLVTVGLVRGGVIKFVFFPETDNDFLTAKIELPTGTPLAETEAVAAQALAGWRRVEAETPLPAGKVLTEAIFTLVGATGGDDMTTGNHLFQIFVELLPSEERNIHYRELAQAWEKHTGRIANAVSTEFASTGHGPGGKPIEVTLLSGDPDVLLAAARELAAKLDSLLGVYDVQLDYRPGKREFRVQLKPEAYPLGFTVAEVASQLRHGFYGGEPVRVQRGRDDVRVKIRYPLAEGRSSVDSFENLYLKTSAGLQVPLSSVANVRVAEGYTTIRRKNRKRTITVGADVNRREANAAEIMLELEANYLPELMRRHPRVAVTSEGQTQERRESLNSLVVGFPLALVGIYLIIASIFRSYLQPIVIMLTIPFGLVGAVYGHLLFDLPLTMMSLFGMVALTGIVVNDSIVLIEAVNSRLAQGMPFMAALREGGKRRFRAIFLTTLTTFCGLTPIIMEKSLQAQFLIPMAIAIAFGVAFATGVTLVVMPCLLGAVNDLRRVFWLLFRGSWPTAEVVEPGARRKTAGSQTAP